MNKLQPKEKITLFNFYALLTLIVIIIAFLLPLEQWFWLIFIGLFIVIFFLFFHICDKLNTKYVKKNTNNETNDEILAIIQARSKKRMLRYAEKSNKSPDEIREMLERSSNFMKDDEFVIGTMFKVFNTLLFSSAIGYIIYLYAHFILKIFKHPNPSTEEFIGVIGGFLCFILTSLFFLIRFCKKVVKGIKEARKNDIITR